MKIPLEESTGIVCLYGNPIDVGVPIQLIVDSDPQILGIFHLFKRVTMNVILIFYDGSLGGDV